MIDERRHSLVGLAVVVAVGAVMGALAVATIFWALSLIFHLVSWVFHLAVIVGVVAFVWWLLVGRRRAHTS
jgi:hypothetical protein